MSHFFSLVRVLPEIHQNAWLRGMSHKGEAYLDHALIWKLFPDNHQRDFIFRKLQDGRSYYVVSKRQPHAPDVCGVDLKIKRYAPIIDVGDALQFDLRVNPVVSRKSPDGRNHRFDVLLDTQKNPYSGSDPGLAWLLRRVEDWGLSVKEESVLQSAHRIQKMYRKGQSITFSSLDFRGIAEVSNKEKLENALLNGVGHAKGFGCGLLMIKRF